MLERFTKQAREVVADAEREARTLGAPAVGEEHLLIAAVKQVGRLCWTPMPPLAPPRPSLVERLRAGLAPEDPDAVALAAIGIDLAAVRRTVEEAFGPGAWEAPRRRRRLPFTAEAKAALQDALREALDLRVRRIAPDVILLGLLRRNGTACRLLSELGLDPAALHERLRGHYAPLAR